MNFGLFLDAELIELFFDNRRKFDPKRPKTAKGDSPLPIVASIQSQLDRCFAEQAPATQLACKRAKRLADLIRLTNGWVRQFKSIDKSVTGIGIPTLLENGIHLDWGTGWPIVPGAGIKGAVLAWASAPERTLEELNVATEDDFIDLHIAVFGCGPGKDAEDGETAAGGIVFHDAWYLPSETVPIIFDVMTPHYGNYQKGGEQVTAPADWLDPNPISYLCVREGIQLQVGLAPRTSLDDELIDVARDWLTRALADTGLGAKESTGFGRFVPAPTPSAPAAP